MEWTLPRIFSCLLRQRVSQDNFATFKPSGAERSIKPIAPPPITSPLCAIAAVVRSPKKTATFNGSRKHAHAGNLIFRRSSLRSTWKIHIIGLRFARPGFAS